MRARCHLLSLVVLLFELSAVYVHYDVDYAGSENLLLAPLAVEATWEVLAFEGASVTVVRKKIEVGEELALTTARGLDEVTTDGYTLIVFDESFRLMEP